MRRTVVSYRDGIGQEWGVTLSCGHTSAAIGRYNQPPKTATCHACARLKMTQVERDSVLWGPLVDRPRTASEHKAVAEETMAIIGRYPGVTPVASGIERYAGMADCDGEPMSDVAVVYVSFPGGESTARCTRGHVASFRTKTDRTEWERWRARCALVGG